MSARAPATLKPEFLNLKPNNMKSKEHKRLSNLWATGKASKKQIMRCMELDRKFSINKK